MALKFTCLLVRRWTYDRAKSQPDAFTLHAAIERTWWPPDQRFSWCAEIARRSRVINLDGSGPCLAGTIDEIVAHHYWNANEWPNDLQPSHCHQTIKFKYTWFWTFDQSMTHHSKIYIWCNTLVNWALTAIRCVRYSHLFILSDVVCIEDILQWTNSYHELLSRTFITSMNFSKYSTEFQ